MTGTIEPRQYLGASGRRHVWVADRMGITQSYLSHLLAGRRNWTPELQHRFANAIGMDASAFNFARDLAADGSGRDGDAGSVAVEAARSAQGAREGAVEYSTTSEPSNGR